MTAAELNNSSDADTNAKIDSLERTLRRSIIASVCGYALVLALIVGLIVNPASSKVDAESSALSATGAAGTYDDVKVPSTDVENKLVSNRNQTQVKGRLKGVVADVEHAEENRVLKGKKDEAKKGEEPKGKKKQECPTGAQEIALVNVGDQHGDALHVGYISAAAVQAAWDAVRSESAPIRGFARSDSGARAGTFLITTSTSFRTLSDSDRVIYEGAYVDGKPDQKYRIECPSQNDPEMCDVFEEPSDANARRLEQTPRHLQNFVACQSNADCVGATNANLPAPFCDTRFLPNFSACRECLEDDHCPGIEVCSRTFCKECCFSALATVLVKGKGRIPMKELEIGDMVETADGKFDLVYSFGHREEHRSAEFLQIHTSGFEPLELTAKHMVFVRGHAVPASSISVGDMVDLGDGGVAKVEKISKVTRSGVYTPITTSGTIVVDGVIASTYASLQETEFLEIGGVRTPMTYQWLSHAAVGARRTLCAINFKFCEQETYTNGIATWVAEPHQFFLWVFEQHVVIQSVVFLFAVSYAMVSVVAEAVLTSSLTLICFAIVALTFNRHRAKSMKTKTL